MRIRTSIPNEAETQVKASQTAISKNNVLSPTLEVEITESPGLSDSARVPYRTKFRVFSGEAMYITYSISSTNNQYN